MRTVVEQRTQRAETTNPATVKVEPITDTDLDEVGQFLGHNFPPDTSPEHWAQAWRRSCNLPGSQAPNHGMLLRSGDSIVGAYPAIYSTRQINGRTERFCNLAVWYVDPQHRTGSIRMVKALLAQPGYHFTDLTPIDVVQKLNLRLGFEYLDTDTALVVNLPWPTTPGRVKISADRAVIDATLPEPARTYYRDHTGCRWARHLVLLHRGDACYVQWRPEARKGRTMFASVQYVSDPPLFRAGFQALGRHFLTRHRLPFTLVEMRVAGGRIGPSLLLPNHRKRMFRSATLGPEQVDYLYSEISAAP
jgi:hypothetical protein